MSFNNRYIFEPVEGKPHIIRINGWWRVSRVSMKRYQAYNDAHRFVIKLNDRLIPPVSGRPAPPLSNNNHLNGTNGWGYQPLPPPGPEPRLFSCKDNLSKPKGPPNHKIGTGTPSTICICGCLVIVICFIIAFLN